MDCVESFIHSNIISDLDSGNLHRCPVAIKKMYGENRGSDKNGLPRNKY